MLFIFPWFLPNVIFLFLLAMTVSWTCLVFDDWDSFEEYCTGQTFGSACLTWDLSVFFHG